MRKHREMKHRLEFYAKRAFERGFMEQSTISWWALARIEELEAELAHLQASHRRGALAKAQKLTPEQRKQWGKDASKRRWSVRARINPPGLFTP